MNNPGTIDTVMTFIERVGMPYALLVLLLYGLYRIIGPQVSKSVDAATAYLNHQTETIRQQTETQKTMNDSLININATATRSDDNHHKTHGAIHEIINAGEIAVEHVDDENFSKKILPKIQAARDRLK